MICKKCGKNNAEFYYKQTVNGNTKEYALCSACAEELKKKGEFDIKIPSIFEDFDQPFMFNDFLGINDLLGIPSNNGKMLKKAEKKRCTLCSSTFDDLVKSGKVGCAECYKVFADELKHSIESIHGKEKYTGRRPLKYKAKETKQDKIKLLKAEMKDAIKKQDFEKAAVLRDKIHDLESENEV